MNGKRPKKYKPRQCSIPDEYIAALAEELTIKFMSFGEVIGFMKNCTGKEYSIDALLALLEARGYLVTEDRKRSTYGFRSYYGIMTKEKYQKIEEEHRENAKRRLLAAVSY